MSIFFAETYTESQLRFHTFLVSSTLKKYQYKILNFKLQWYFFACNSIIDSNRSKDCERVYSGLKGGKKNNFIFFLTFLFIFPQYLMLKYNHLTLIKI